MLASLWSSTMAESLREMDYMAKLAGIHAGIAIDGQNLALQIHAYNDSIENYISDMTKKFQSFEVDE